MIFGDQSFPLNIESAMTNGMAETLQQLSVEGGVNPATVNRVIEFGCGTGRITRAILETFPTADVQAIDIDDLLSSDLKGSPRVNFVRGEFVKVLKQDKVVPADVVVLYHTGSEHGFGKKTLPLLAWAVGQGILITGGHVGPLFDDAFLGKFTQINGHDTGGLTADIVWRVK